MNNALNHAMYDVIIAGAGPVGLFLACELALAQCSVLVLEKADIPDSPLKQMPFGLRGLSAPSIEALHRRGLLSQLKVAPPKQGRGGHFAGIQFFVDEQEIAQWPDRLHSSTDVSLMVEMADLEEVLARHALSLGVEIRRGRAVTELRQGADGVTVQAGGEEFRARWLVGCDGGRSVVRKLSGFEFAGTEPAFTGYTTQLELENADKLRPGRVFTDEGMYFQSQPGCVVMQDFDGGAFHGAGQPITLEHVQSLLRRISGTDVTVLALQVAATWTDRARQATRYRNGRILLAGDAAHIHSPLGGQGLNLGLGDAMNLGWKLAATIQGKAPPELIDTYHSERHPIGAQVLDWSRAQVLLMRPDPHARALQAIMRDLLQTRDGAAYMARRVWGLDLKPRNAGDIG
jgi:2-polyprenyl-6-methoxyphenol hydroxylase-like FAD-dependent oxidoreductase